MAIQANQLAYIRKTKTSYKPIARANNSPKKMWDKAAFLWGDPVFVFDVSGTTAKFSAKGHHFEEDVSDLMEDPILQIYQIDVGQGDATLIHFPDDRWMLVDGGPPRAWSNTGKIAFDFLMWKIFVDFSWRKEFLPNPEPFHIDSVVITHPDYDHYGGLMSLISKMKETDNSEKVTLGTVFHNGLGRFTGPYEKYENGEGFSQLGPVKGSALPDAWLTALIDGFSDVRKYGRLTASRRWKLTGSYGKFLKDLEKLEGESVDELKRVHFDSGHLPDFGPGDHPDYSIKVLGPVEEELNGKAALRFIDTASRTSDPSKTRNGLSVVLRLDYGDARILLTGDLNFKSQALLFEHVPAQEYDCDVAKACHHGAEDVSWKFLQAMDPVAVLFSSGDNEGYAHPRAKVLGWSGAFSEKRVKGRDKKFLGLQETKYISPLIYSTELSRSVRIHDVYKATDSSGTQLHGVQLQARGRTKPENGDTRHYKKWLLADNLIYGLINVRTDGEKVVIGVLKEDSSSFQVEQFDVS